MTTYFTADTHFGHARIIELCARPFKDVAEMNATMIENYNAVVGKDDTCYFLGDILMGPQEAWGEIVGALNGRTIFLPGNHDRHSKAHTSREDKREFWAEKYRALGFTEVWMDPAPGDAYLNTDLGVLMSHYPYAGDSGENDRHLSLRPEDRGYPLLHGHVHTAWRTKGSMFNVGVDVNDFAPVSEQAVSDWVMLTELGAML